MSLIVIAKKTRKFQGFFPFLRCPSIWAVIIYSFRGSCQMGAGRKRGTGNAERGRMKRDERREGKETGDGRVGTRD